jgi:hypothetical protein
LINIKEEAIASYNKVRKPVDLYIEHLVATSSDLDITLRSKLAPLLFLPLDSQIFSNPAIFPLRELQNVNLSRNSTYQSVATEKTYTVLQSYLLEKSARISQGYGVAFHRIYFDMFWGDRFRNQGSNLFEVNP